MNGRSNPFKSGVTGSSSGIFTTLGAFIEAADLKEISQLQSRYNERASRLENLIKIFRFNNKLLARINSAFADSPLPADGYKTTETNPETLKKYIELCEQCIASYEDVLQKQYKVMISVGFKVNAPTSIAAPILAPSTDERKSHMLNKKR